MSADLDAIDRLQAKSAQLHALASTLYGSAGAAFREHSDDVQDGVLWLLADLAGEVKALGKTVANARATA
jgi:hypothetical protein